MRNPPQKFIKEKYRLEMEIKEREHQYQVELVKIQHDNELIKAKG